MSIPATLDDLLCFAVYSANHAFNRAYKPMLDRLGLTYPQYLAMLTLWRGDGRTVGEIGGRMLLETNTLTPMLKRLEAMGLLRRVRDAADERQVRVHLTEAGRALRAKAQDIPEEMAACLERGSAEIGALTATLTGLRDTLLARLRP